MFGLPLHAVARVLFWLAVIVSLIAALVYLMRRLREGGDNQNDDAGDMLTGFRDIHAQGKLSDEEYRSIRSRLAAKMQGELKHDDDKS